MQPPRLLEALDKHLRRGLDKQNGIAQAHLIERIERLKQHVEAETPAHVGHERDLLIPPLRRKTQPRKLRDHLRGHIVHTVKAEILKIGRRLALSCAGKAGYNDKLHNLLLPDPHFRLQTEAGIRINGFLYQLDRFKHIPCRRAAAIDNKACVLARDLRAAHAASLETRRLDQCAGIRPRRTLERAAGRRELQRLRGAAFSISSRIRAPISSASPGRSANTVFTIMHSMRSNALVR